MIVCSGAHETAIIFPTSIPLSNEHHPAQKHSHRREAIEDGGRKRQIRQIGCTARAHYEFMSDLGWVLHA